LKDCVNQGCAPHDISSNIHIFVRTASNGSWTPTPPSAILSAGSRVEYYRYEIFAPDNILVHRTLCAHASKKEVCFHGGISLNIFGHVSYKQPHRQHMKPIQGLIHIMLYYFYNHHISSINIYRIS